MPRIDPEIQLAFDIALKLGGADPREMSDSNKALVWGELTRSPKVRNSALLYLSATSQRSEVMFQRLKKDIADLFKLDLSSDRD